MKEFFDELKHDHAEVKEIMDKLMDSSDGAIKTREKMLTQLKQELIPHLKAEERTLYPVLKDKKQARSKALESIEEHGLTEIAFQKLMDAPIDDETWRPKMKVLQELVEHHIEEEEEEIFEVARDSIQKEDFKNLLEAFRQEKEEIKSEI